MADGIGRIAGGGSGNGVFWNNNRGKQNNNVEQKQEGQVAVPENKKTVVDEQKVWEFMANNNYFVAPAKTNNNKIADDVAMQARIEDFISQYSIIMTTIEAEFGKEVAPTVFDMMMGKLMEIFNN